MSRACCSRIGRRIGSRRFGVGNDRENWSGNSCELGRRPKAESANQLLMADANWLVEKCQGTDLKKERRSKASCFMARIMLRWSILVGLVLLGGVHLTWGQVDIFQSEVYKKRKGLVLNVKDTDADTFAAINFGNNQPIYKSYFVHANPQNFSGTIVDLNPYSLKRIWVYANTQANKELILRSGLRFDSKVYLVSSKPDNQSIIFSEFYTIHNETAPVERIVEDWKNLKIQNEPEYIWKRRVNVEGIHFYVGAMNYVSMISLPDDKSDQATGFCSEIIRLLSKSMNFTYEYKTPPRNVFGTFSESKEWTGLAGLVVRNEVDFTANLVPMSYERADEMNFSRGITLEQSVFVYKKSTSGAIPLQRMFTPGVAVMFVVVFVVLLLSAIFIAYLYRLGHLHAVMEVVLSILASFMNQGFTERFSANSMRILLYTSLLLGILFVNILSARLASLLSVQLEDDPVNQFEDVIDKELELFVQGQSSREEFFSLANKGSAANYIWETQLKDDPYQRPPTMVDVINNAFESDEGVIWTNPVVYKYWAVRNKSKACEMSLRRERRSIHHSFGVRKDWPYLQAMNYQLLKFIENGLISQLQAEWHHPQHLEQSSYCPKREESIKMVGIPDVKFYFFVLFTGVGLCVVFFVGEMIGRRKNLRAVLINQRKKNAQYAQAKKRPRSHSIRSFRAKTAHVKRSKPSSVSGGSATSRGSERSTTRSPKMSSVQPYFTFTNEEQQQYLP
eukprot:TCALIF_08772-PA protein Name:"Similar to Nmdar1 Glutamate [NMDA] receptor subunit 1 (Drosophila mojavensis)" AED:0.33 eAED:0.33 QI:0/0/0/0.5/1/1/2/0/732